MAAPASAAVARNSRRLTSFPVATFDPRLMCDFVRTREAVDVCGHRPAVADIDLDGLPEVPEPGLERFDRLEQLLRHVEHVADDSRVGRAGHDRAVRAEVDELEAGD